MKIKELTEIIQSFNEISGIEVSISNTKEHLCFSKKRTSNFCNVIHSSADALAICRKTDYHYMQQVKEWGCSVGYVCPFGIDEYIVPLEHGGVDYGVLFSSLGFREENFDKEALLDRIDAMGLGIPREQLSEEIDRVPRFDSQKRIAYETLARVLAKQIAADELVSDEELTIGTRIKNYIKDNITRDITLSDISYHLHLSTVTLTQHFRSEFGMTIMQYVTRRRLRMAEELLLSTDGSVKEVAMRVGFDEAEYFSRCFKKHYGITPTEYREKKKAEEGNNN